MNRMPKYLALTGGVGGAKLGLGLAELLPPEQLAFLVNTGDDFTHLGLHVSPDLDTLMYALSGESNQETGWGRRQESWRFIETLRGPAPSRRSFPACPPHSPSNLPGAS